MKGGHFIGFGGGGLHGGIGSPGLRCMREHGSSKPSHVPSGLRVTCQRRSGGVATAATAASTDGGGGGGGAEPNFGQSMGACVASSSHVVPSNETMRAVPSVGTPCGHAIVIGGGGLQCTSGGHSFHSNAEHVPGPLTAPLIDHTRCARRPLISTPPPLLCEQPPAATTATNEAAKRVRRARAMPDGSADRGRAALRAP